MSKPDDKPEPAKPEPKPLFEQIKERFRRDLENRDFPFHP